MYSQRWQVDSELCLAGFASKKAESPVSVSPLQGSRQQTTDNRQQTTTASASKLQRRTETRKEEQDISHAVRSVEHHGLHSAAAWLTQARRPPCLLPTSSQQTAIFTAKARHRQHSPSQEIFPCVRQATGAPKESRPPLVV